jgi:hypothetical protein
MRGVRRLSALCEVHNLTKDATKPLPREICKTLYKFEVSCLLLLNYRILGELLISVDYNFNTKT